MVPHNRRPSYATRLARDGVTVNAVAPSLIETDMTGQTVQVNGGLHFN